VNNNHLLNKSQVAFRIRS